MCDLVRMMKSGEYRKRVVEEMINFVRWRRNKKKRHRQMRDISELYRSSIHNMLESSG